MIQKEEEYLVMQLFRKKLESFPKGKLVPHESPDFLLKVNSRKTIGIELTRLIYSEKTLYDNILRTIHKKNEKLGLYSNMKIAEHLLLIYSDDVSIMKSGHLANNLAKWIFESGFRKVYLFDLFEGKIFEIK
ncbi:MAG: hypothetical protein KQI35_09560 [Bacteroidetes bacterium]|nr:hypothetical protein [Bacteroidota bacterium]